MSRAERPKIGSEEQARALLREEGLVPLTQVRDFVSLVESIAGGPVKGSWWGHPAGKQIFRIATALEAVPDVLVVKLLAGKVTFVDRALFAPLYRIVTDRTWRKRTIERLSEEARALLGALPAKKAVRLDELEAARSATKKTKDELEKSLLVRAYDVHTDRGTHVTVFEPWKLWATKAIEAEAAALDLDGASARLRTACRGAATPLDSAARVTKS